MVQDRTFRNDLYYRLAVIHVPIKPLREISELKPHLIKRFLAAINQKRSEPLVLSDKIHSKLMAYHYPGNIREMHNLLQQISVLTDGDDDIPARLENVSASAVMVEPSAMDQPLEAGIGLKQITADYEYEVIRHAIEKFGSKRKAATALDVDIGTIVRKTKRQENP